MKILLGTSGYSYKHWADGVFYPKGLAQGKWLEFYCKQFNCVELNVTFYRLPKKETFKGWNKRSPKDFSFVIKGSRFITHIKRLKDAEDSLALFADRISPLKAKVNCVLWQLPPSFKRNIERLDNFCKCLKKTKILKTRQHVFEFREESWFCKETYEILKKYNACLCFADSPKRIGEEVLTADFAYIRFHGGSVLYGSNYSKKELDSWAKKVKSLSPKIKRLYVFFNNDAQGFAPKNAVTFRSIIN